MKRAALLVALLVAGAVAFRLYELAAAVAPVSGVGLLVCAAAGLGAGIAVYVLCQPDPWKDTP